VRRRIIRRHLEALWHLGGLVRRAGILRGATGEEGESREPEERGRRDEALECVVAMCTVAPLRSRMTRRYDALQRVSVRHHPPRRLGVPAGRMVFCDSMHGGPATIFGSGAKWRRWVVRGGVHRGPRMATNAGCSSVRPVGRVDRYARQCPWIDRHHDGFTGLFGRHPPGHPNVDSSRRDESTESLDAKSADECRLRAHSLGAIIGRYKSVCTKQIRGDGRPEFEWQSRFYDRIIRDAEAFRAVRRYIRAHLDKSAVRNEEDGFDLHS
jgi:hypothetical protein